MKKLHGLKAIKKIADMAAKLPPDQLDKINTKKFVRTVKVSIPMPRHFYGRKQSSVMKFERMLSDMMSKIFTPEVLAEIRAAQLCALMPAYQITDTPEGPRIRVLDLAERSEFKPDFDAATKRDLDRFLKPRSR